MPGRRVRRFTFLKATATLEAKEETYQDVHECVNAWQAGLAGS